MDYGHLLVITYLLPFVAFALGVLWNDAGHQLKKEREEDEQIRVGSHPHGRRINIR